MELIAKDKMTSREISELVNKEHSNVMRDIRALLEQGCAEFNFELGEYEDKNNQKRPMYILTKKGSLLLASGYNALLREKIIDRWEQLENAIALPKDYLSALKALVASEETRIQQEQLLLEQKPLVEFAETVSKSATSISIGDFAKVIADEKIKIGQNQLFKWLRNNKYLDKKNIPYQQFVSRGYFEVIEQTYSTPYGDKINLKTLVTGKGQIYFVEKLRQIYCN